MGAQRKWLVKLSTEQRDELFIQLVRAIASVRSPVEAASLVKDLLTESEVGMLAKRLEIARLLMRGLTFEEITEGLKVSHATVARINHWLQNSGEGYRLAVERLRPAEERDRGERLVRAGARRQRATMYNWPQALLEELVANASKKQKQKIKELLTEVKVKTQLNQQLEDVFKSQGYL